jgi:predicted metal-binding membrane protein
MSGNFEASREDFCAAGGDKLRALRIRRARRTHWLAFFGATLFCWVLLFCMAIPSDLRALDAAYGASFVELLCGGVDVAGFPTGFAMWALMSAAMMAPTAVPAFATYDDLSHVAPAGFGAVAGGYFAVWVGFSALAAAAQSGLQAAGLVSALGQSLSVPLTMALLIGAGAYQFSRWKHACLSRCRAPVIFFLQHWDEGPFRNGLRLGADCLGCCWALMSLGFVGGTMNLAFMGLAMLLMILEKLPDIGRHLTTPLGAGLVASGLAIPLF